MTPAYKYHKFYLNKLYNCFCGGQRNVRGCQVGKFHTMYNVHNVFNSRFNQIRSIFLRICYL